jgi:hypothetical protein
LPRFYLRFPYTPGSTIRSMGFVVRSLGIAVRFKLQERIPQLFAQ